MTKSVFGSDDQHIEQFPLVTGDGEIIIVHFVVL